MKTGWGWLIATAVLIIVVTALGGCATYLNAAMDKAGEPMERLAIDYCQAKDYRKKALGVLINGRLADIGIKVMVVCPGDVQEQASLQSAD